MSALEGIPESGPALSRQRCFNHRQREAVARCPECARYYCRECVTEHDGRVVCASCLPRLASAAGEARPRWAILARTVQLGMALALLWLFFYALGNALLSLPDSFHEGTLWQAGTLDE